MYGFRIVFELIFVIRLLWMWLIGVKVNIIRICVVFMLYLKVKIIIFIWFIDN